jgi:hypothetical protein
MSMSSLKNAAKNYDVEVTNASFENVAKLKYSGTGNRITIWKTLGVNKFQRILVTIHYSIFSPLI